MSFKKTNLFPPLQHLRNQFGLNSDRLWSDCEEVAHKIYFDMDISLRWGSAYEK